MNISRFLSLFLLKVVIISFYATPLSAQNSSAVKVNVGVILDLKTVSGKMKQTCISLALADFYTTQNHSTTIFPHFRDSNIDDVDAASAAIDLLKNVEVQAILGPQMSTQAEFVIDLGKKVKVPILSPATSPALSPNQNTYFIRVAQSSRAQVKAIAAIVKAFDWKEVVFIYEDSDLEIGILPHLTNAMMEVSVSVTYMSVLSPSVEDDEIHMELDKLMAKQTRVFIVHLRPNIGSRLFQKAKDVGMMREGYVWIITDALTGLLDSMEPLEIDNMQGVIGIKPYVQASLRLKNFTRRFRKKFYQENHDMDKVEPDVSGLWAYDSITALAMAFERVDTAHKKFTRVVSGENLTDLETIGTSNLGPSLIKSIRNIKLRGLSGHFNIVDGELSTSTFQIVNVIGRGKGIGFWTEEYGISKKPNPTDRTAYKANKDDLGTIIWPGDSPLVPKGWEIKLRIGVPVKRGLKEFIEVTTNPQTKGVTVTGFCIDVFEEVLKNLHHTIQFEYKPFERSHRKAPQYYDELVHQVFLGKFDAVVGDVTIIANRSESVDFTLPFTESGVAAVVPVKQYTKKRAWIFLRPLSKELWVTTGAFFIFIGFVIWVLEHRVNSAFRGPRHKQVGMIFWFSFSTLVFAHREKVISNLSRFVIIVWVFVVLVLTSSYTASLTSMLTVQQLQPTITSISDLKKNREFIGVQDGTFVRGLLKRMKFDSSKFRSYSTLEEIDDALTRGSQNGGVAAIIDELPYIRLFLGKYCDKYTIIEPIYKTAGFGFAFPKGSPLVPAVSTAILSMTESGSMMRISDKWFRNETNCSQKDETLLASDSLALESFVGIFLIAGVSALSALLVFFIKFLNQNKVILASDDSTWQKIRALAIAFFEVNDDYIKVFEKHGEGDEGLISQIHRLIIAHQAQTSIPQSPGVFTPDEEHMTTAPPSPVHDTISVTENAVPER